jgi:hypothetical protein
VTANEVAPKSPWLNGQVPEGAISGRELLQTSRAHVDASARAARRRERRSARRERLTVAFVGGLTGACFALSARWLLDRGLRRG